MGKKNWNPSAQRTANQMNSTLEMLMEKALAISYNAVPPVNDIVRRCQITWNGHISHRANSGKSFTMLDQYIHILQTNSYHCLLFDGSIIRANFEFEDDKLLRQNLLWWPAPYNYGDILQEGYPPVELFQNFCEDKDWPKIIRMRSPIRIDFDSSNNAEKHPPGHLHIQNEETRLNINNPVCFNRFVNFIFRNFYPQFGVNFSEYDFIKYKTPDLQSYPYIFSQIII